MIFLFSLIEKVFYKILFVQDQYLLYCYPLIQNQKKFLMSN